MKNTCKKISLALIAILCMIFIISNTSQAAVTSTPLTLNNAWASASITSSDEPVYYSITLPSDGALTLTCQSEISCLYWELYSEDLVSQYFSNSISGGSENSPVAKSKEYTLKAGTYLLKLYTLTDYNLGNVKVKGYFEAVTANDIEPNDTFSQAMPLNSNQEIMGYIAYNDKDDYYKISMPKTGTVEFSFTTALYLFDVVIYNSNFEKVEFDDFYTYGETETNTMKVALSAGTYYVKISKSYSTDYAGYRFMYNANSATAIQITPSTLSMETQDYKTLTATAVPSTAILPELKWSSSNTKVATVYNGTVRAFKPGVTTITATATDGSNVYGTCVVTVIPDEVNFFDKTQTPTSITLKWNRIDGADGYRVFKYNSSSKKYVKYKDTKKTSLKITKLKAEKKYKFKVVAYVNANGQKVFGFDAGGEEFWTAPKKLKASKITSITKYGGDYRYTYINVKWKKVPGATGYQVYGKTPGGSWEFMGSTKKLQMKLYAGRGFTYSIRVRPYRKKHGLITYGNWSKTKKYTSR